MVTVPGPKVVISPSEFTDTTALFEDDQVPPPLPLVVSVVVSFSHKEVRPDSVPALGPERTVTTIVAISLPEQPATTDV